MKIEMPSLITLRRPDVMALVEHAAEKLTGGNKTEAVALAMRRLLEQEARVGSLFGAHPGSVRVGDGVDLTQSIFIGEFDAATGREITR